MLKKSVTAAIYISWAFFTAVLVAGLVFFQNNKTQSSVRITPSVSSPGGTSGSSTTLSVKEIAKHNSSSDCWLIINQQVYNVTAYLNQHPGNASTILPYCGQDGTSAFDTKGRSAGNSHSTFANDLLKDYLLGSVGQAVTQSTPLPKVTATPGTKTAPSGTDGAPLTLDTQEIAKHNSSSDCWLIINQQVYNVTTYLSQHPGNASTILPYCGQDGTSAFDTKGRSSGNTHSSFASNLLSQFIIGSIGETISQSTVNPSVTIPPGGGDDDDDDDD